MNEHFHRQNPKNFRSWQKPLRRLHYLIVWGISFSVFLSEPRAAETKPDELTSSEARGGPGQHSKPIDYSGYARLLQKYVTPSGVRYEAWYSNKKDLRALDAFLSRLAEVNTSGYSRAEEMAFYINLYNAAMLQAVFRSYPIRSVKDIGPAPFSIFKEGFIEQNGRQLSPDDVEKAILLKKFPDPRIHFVINCASESCPVLLEEPFTAEKLESQMERQTRLFAQSPRAAVRPRDGGPVRYSKLFKWYSEDFPGDHPAEYLNRYRVRSLTPDQKVDWIEYDWSLNAAR